MNGDLATLTKLVSQFNECDFDVEAAGEFSFCFSQLYLPDLGSDKRFASYDRCHHRPSRSLHYPPPRARQEGKLSKTSSYSAVERATVLNFSFSDQQGIKVAAQNAHQLASGAYTGEISCVYL